MKKLISKIVKEGRIAADAARIAIRSLPLTCASLGFLALAMVALSARYDIRQLNDSCDQAWHTVRSLRDSAWRHTDMLTADIDRLQAKNLDLAREIERLESEKTVSASSSLFSPEEFMVTEERYLELLQNSFVLGKAFGATIDEASERGEIDDYRLAFLQGLRSSVPGLTDRQVDGIWDSHMEGYRKYAAEKESVETVSSPARVRELPPP